MSGTAIFLDTSIQIARFFRERELKDCIESRLKDYDISVSSSVVLQEFKRRVFRDALYLLNLLNNKGSYQKVKRHIDHVLPPQMRRKQQICLQLLETIFETATDTELTERAKRILRVWLKTGMTIFRESVSHIISGSDCFLSKQSVIEKKPYERYELGEIKCSKTKNNCPIINYLEDSRDICTEIYDFLSETSQDIRTEEIQNSIEFLKHFLYSDIDIRKKDPCYTVGDLIISIESQNIPNFYTMNLKESKYFCNALNQNLIYRPNSPEKEEETFNFIKE